jgi:hypothetical protein
MRALKRPSRGVRTLPALDDEPGTSAVHDRPVGAHAPGTADPVGAVEPAGALDTTDASDTAEEFDEDSYGIFRVYCPHCTRPIALLAREEVLPEHALCSSPWNPFGLTVCAGSGRSVADAVPLEADEGAEQDVTVLLTLPAGLDWRKQPFSHAALAISRPIRPRS